MSDTVIPNPSAIADAMLKRVGELLREHDANKASRQPGNSPFRLASYFANEAPDGAKPQYAQVAEEFSHFPDVFPLYFGPSDPIPDSPTRLTPERITKLWNGMPGGHDGFCKQWGYQQFAQVIEDEVRAALIGCASPQAGASSDNAPTFGARHVSLKQRGQNYLLTLELDGIESAPRYLVTPVNLAVVREPRASDKDKA